MVKNKWYVGVILCLIIGCKLIYQQQYSPIININSSQMYEMINQNKNFTLLIGRDSCSSCVIAKDAIVSEQRKNFFNILPNKIYYYNIDKDQTTTRLKSFLKSYNIKEVPTAIKFSQGDKKILANFDTSDQIKNLF